MAPHRIRPFHLFALSALLVVMLAGAGSNPSPIPQGTTSFTSRSAEIPDLTWNPLNGDEFKLRSYEGFGVVYSFIDPTDDRQLAQLTILKDIMSRYEARGLKIVSIVAVALPDTIEPLSFFEGIEWPVVVWDDQDALRRAGVTSIPTNSIVDRRCRVVMRQPLVTDRTKSMLEGAIAAALR